MRKTATIGTLAILIAPALAWAHPQHATTTLLEGFVHPFIGLDHVLAMIAVGVWAARTGARAVWAVPSAFVAAMLVGAVIGTIGIEVSAVEPLVAATVLLLGLLIMSRFRVSVIEAALLAAAFAVFHGAAHIADAPANANPVAYGAGLMTATVLLHLAGISAALAARGRDTILRVAAAPIAFVGAWMLVSRIT